MDQSEPIVQPDGEQRMQESETDKNGTSGQKSAKKDPIVAPVRPSSMEERLPSGEEPTEKQPNAGKKLESRFAGTIEGRIETLEGMLSRFVGLDMFKEKVEAIKKVVKEDCDWLYDDSLEKYETMRNEFGEALAVKERQYQKDLEKIDEKIKRIEQKNEENLKKVRERYEKRITELEAVNEGQSAEITDLREAVQSLAAQLKTQKTREKVLPGEQESRIHDLESGMTKLQMNHQSLLDEQYQTQGEILKLRKKLADQKIEESIGGVRKEVEEKMQKMKIPQEAMEEDDQSEDDEVLSLQSELFVEKKDNQRKDARIQELMEEVQRLRRRLYPSTGVEVRSAEEMDSDGLSPSTKEEYEKKLKESSEEARKEMLLMYRNQLICQRLQLQNGFIAMGQHLEDGKVVDQSDSSKS